MISTGQIVADAWERTVMLGRCLPSLWDCQKGDALCRVRFVYWRGRRYVWMWNYRNGAWGWTEG